MAEKPLVGCTSRHHLCLPTLGATRGSNESNAQAAHAFVHRAINSLPCLPSWLCSLGTTSKKVLEKPAQMQARSTQLKTAHLTARRYPKNGLAASADLGCAAAEWRSFCASACRSAEAAPLLQPCHTITPHRFLLTLSYLMRR